MDILRPGLKEFVLGTAIALGSIGAPNEAVAEVEQAEMHETNGDSLIKDLRTEIIGAALFALLITGGGVHAKRRSVNNAINKIYNESIQISIHTFISGDEDNNLHIERVCRKSMQEILDSEALGHLLARAIRKKLKAKDGSFERFHPFLDLSPKVLQSLQFRLAEYCEERMRKIESIDAVDSVNEADEIEYREFIASLTFERYEDEVGNVTPRLILVAEEEMRRKNRAETKVKPEREYQRLRVQTHNAMVEEYDRFKEWERAKEAGEYAEEEVFQVFRIRIPVGVK